MSDLRGKPLWAILLLAFSLPCAWAEPPADLGLAFVPVGDPNNSPCPLTGKGTVAYAFEMGACEVTNAQYAQFLNAAALYEDPFELYNPNMETGLFGGIGRVREGDRYRYTPLQGFEKLPVVYVSWYDAARFCNWLQTGSTEGDANTGAYDTTLFGKESTPPVLRKPGAQYWLPTVDEWVKAGFFDPAKRDNDGYWLYPVQSDAKPESAPPPGSPHSANYFDGCWAAPEPYLTPAGAYLQAKSHYGTYDQGGNVMEWLETPEKKGWRCALGGDATKFDYALRIDYTDAELPELELYIIGFRVAKANAK